MGDQQRGIARGKLPESVSDIGQTESVEVARAGSDLRRGGETGSGRGEGCDDTVQLQGTGRSDGEADSEAGEPGCENRTEIVAAVSPVRRSEIAWSTDAVSGAE